MHQHISCGAPNFFIVEIMWGEHSEQSEQLGAIGATRSTPTIVLTP